MTHTLVLLRHGESTWNAENRFTGWTDVPLSPHGVAEAREAARLLMEGRYSFDVAHTSVLLRATATLDIVLDEIHLDIPVRRHWRLNERHYGALQGLNKSETAKRHGEGQVQLWRRSYDVPPPPLERADERHAAHDPRYAQMPAGLLPASECLKDVVERMLPYWHGAIVPDLLERRRVIVSAHGNSLRAVVKYLDRISDADIPGLNIPTGLPLVYELDEALSPISNRYLGDAAAAAAAARAVAEQARAPGKN